MLPTPDAASNDADRSLSRAGKRHVRMGEMIGAKDEVEGAYN